MSLGYSTFTDSPMAPEEHRLMWDEHGTLCACGCGRQTWREWWDGLRYEPFFSRTCKEAGVQVAPPEKFEPVHHGLPDRFKRYGR